jgi:integration host factor subunit alpha
MTKSEIVTAVYSRVGGFSKKEAADIVELVFETMKETLGRGEKIKISGFGNFVLRDKRQRKGRNPQTGEPLTIDERRVLSFKPSQILKSVLNPHLDADALADENDPMEHDDDELESPAPPVARTAAVSAPAAARVAPRSRERS